MTDGGPLAERLARLIAADGPMTVAAFMGHAVGDYYARREPFGPAGDFVTAPEISQMFGELVGAWMLAQWDAAGRPTPIRLVELGPGRGTLTADLLRTARLVPDFLAAAELHLVETSGRLRAAQAATLAGAPLAATWHDRLEDVPAGPLFIVANEFFDALPIRQFVRAGGAWRERVVGLDGDGRLAFGLGPGRLADAAAPAGAAEGAIFEISPTAQAVMATIAGRIARDGGALVAIDYGHAESGVGDTLQALAGHAFVHPLDRPGEVDLTAHVDFAALARTARAAGAAAWGPIGQGAFLTALGLVPRAERLGRDASPEERAALTAAVHRLAGTGAGEMGALFKVLAVTPADAPPPPSFGG